MGRQSLKLLIGLILTALLLGVGVLLYAWHSPTFNYSFTSNIESNQDYYPALTEALMKEEMQQEKRE